MTDNRNTHGRLYNLIKNYGNIFHPRTSVGAYISKIYTISNTQIQTFIDFLSQDINIEMQKKGGKTRKKSTTRKKINTNNKSCKSKRFTACCPHMAPDFKGRYAATGTKHTLKYKGKKYKLSTCCKMCGDAMKLMAKSKPGLFKKTYIKKIDNKGNIHAKNRKTQEVVQIMRLIKSKTKKLK